MAERGRTATRRPAAARGTTPGDGVSRRSRRAFARRQWSRRWLTWKYVVAAVVLVGGLVAAAWLFWFSGVLAVSTVQVSGTDSLRSEQVRTATGIEEGTPLARVDLEGVQARVQSLAEVRSAEVRREWPDTVVVTVEERVAVAVVEIGGRLRGLDMDGVVFEDYQQPPADLPRVETDAAAGREALQEAAAVVSSLPEDLAARVDHVEVATVDQISLVLRDERTVVWGSAEESDLKAEVLVAMMADRPEADIDVSVPGRPSFTP